MGGLGNQMFQYAAGRSLANRHNARLKLDVSFLESDQKGVSARRAYEMKHLNICADIATPREVAEITGCGNNRIETMLVRIRQSTGLVTLKPNVFFERHFHFDKAFLAAPDNTYLEGYWQSEKYFKDIETIILREFFVKIKPDSINKQIADTIGSVNAISLHIRRADYVTSMTTNETHGTCSTEYYLRAADMIARQVSSPHFFVFSDDPIWVKENIMLDHPMTFVTNNKDDRNYEDLRLMTICRHHIIANSTFSWWGAWLCLNPKKIVIAPKVWFRKFVGDTRDLIPNSWIRI
jgi:hypothetical protein